MKKIPKTLKPGNIIEVTWFDANQSPRWMTREWALDSNRAKCIVHSTGYFVGFTKNPKYVVLANWYEDDSKDVNGVESIPICNVMEIRVLK